MSNDELTDYEKAVDAMCTLARLTRVYYETLIESGFSDKDALILTIEYQKEIITMPGKTK